MGLGLGGGSLANELRAGTRAAKTEEKAMVLLARLLAKSVQLIKHVFFLLLQLAKGGANRTRVCRLPGGIA